MFGVLVPAMFVVPVIVVPAVAFPPTVPVTEIDDVEEVTFPVTIAGLLTATEPFAHRL